MEVDYVRVYSHALNFFASLCDREPAAAYGESGASSACYGVIRNSLQFFREQDAWRLRLTAFKVDLIPLRSPFDS